MSVSIAAPASWDALRALVPGHTRAWLIPRCSSEQATNICSLEQTIAGKTKKKQAHAEFISFD